MKKIFASFALAAFIMPALSFFTGCASTGIQKTPEAKITRIRFEKDSKTITEATISDSIKIKASTKGLKDDTPVTITILEEKGDGTFFEVEKLQSSVRHNRISAEWKVHYVEAEHNEGKNKTASEYKCPEYFFVIECDECKSNLSSPLQLYADFIAVIRFKERVMKHYPYVLKLADGSYRTGETDDEGMIHEKKIPIGPVRIM